MNKITSVYPHYVVESNYGTLPVTASSWTHVNRAFCSVTIVFYCTAMCVNFLV